MLLNVCNCEITCDYEIEPQFVDNTINVIINLS